MRGDGTYERIAWDHLNAQDPRAIGVHQYLMNSETQRHTQMQQNTHL
jgi:hypothetical protein